MQHWTERSCTEDEEFVSDSFVMALLWLLFQPAGLARTYIENVRQALDILKANVSSRINNGR